MKKCLIFSLILVLLLSLPLALAGCRKESDVVKYKASKYKESIDLSKYVLVFSDDFDGALDRSIWGDTRQGTRRDGYWTKNLAFTDGNGNLVIRTEKRGSRYCSDTREREVACYNGSRVKCVFDDCIPFALAAGDFGALSSIHSHTSDLVGNVILEKFNALGAAFAALPEDRTTYPSFYDQAMELYNYYSFVREVKAVTSPLSRSAVIGLNHSLTMTFGEEANLRSVDLKEAVAHLFGFTSASFTDAVQALADACAATSCEAIENGGFHTTSASTIYPVALQNASSILLTYVIVEEDGRVTIWLNDIDAVLRAVNYNGDYYTGESITNRTYCKNTLFVTGPEGVYSGALRTLDLYTHGFGYYEIRCKLPDVPGIWHAFWMMCGDVYNEENGSTDGIEIDVFEYLPNRDAVNCALHWNGYDEAHQNAHMRFKGVGCADGNYHTFGMNWDENGYAFYIDGKKVWTSTGGGICREEGYLKISTEYGEWGNWVGTLDIGDLPVDWIIDYVKIYDKIPA